MRLINETKYQELLAKIPMEERTFRKAVEVAEDMPTIDAVPVVRCKDCKCGKIPGMTSQKDKYRLCALYSSLPIMRLDDFCSYGERRGDG